MTKKDFMYFLLTFFNFEEFLNEKIHKNLLAIKSCAGLNEKKEAFHAHKKKSSTKPWSNILNPFNE